MINIHQRTKGPAKSGRSEVRRAGMGHRNTPRHHPTSGLVRDAHSCEWSMHPILKRCYDADIHTISGKSAVPLTRQTVEIGATLTESWGVENIQTMETERPEEVEPRPSRWRVNTWKHLEDVLLQRKTVFRFQMVRVALRNVSRIAPSVKA